MDWIWALIVLVLSAGLIYTHQKWRKAEEKLKRLEDFHREMGEVLRPLLSNGTIRAEMELEAWPPNFQEEVYWKLISHLYRLEMFFGYLLGFNRDLLELRSNYMRSVKEG